MRIVNVFGVGVVASLLLGACGEVNLEPDDRGQAPARGIGKADGTNSCENRCGGMAPAGCWCDPACSLPENNDCCPDKAQFCDGQPGSCVGHCGGKSPDGCWCDPACSLPQNDDCCPDKQQVCDQTPATCTSNGDCKAGEYCHFKDGECLLPTFNILQGTCKAKPQACAYLYDPVCGCDGQDYDNACLAHEAGTSVASKGTCSPIPVGCSSSSDCKASDYCDQVCNAPGKCAPRPQACTMLIDPVCGCDGVDYDNECLAHEAGTSVDHKGACSPDPCWGAWIDQFGGCRGPADGVLPTSCCEDMCYAINTKYTAAVQAAKACNPFVLALQCYDKVDTDLICPCETYINKPASYTPIAQAVQEFQQAGCEKLTFACPAVMCPNVTGGLCDVNSSTCSDVTQ